MAESVEEQGQHLPSNAFLMVAGLPLLYLSSAMICQFLHGAGIISDPTANMLRATVYIPLLLYAQSNVIGSASFLALFEWLYEVGQLVR